MPVSAAGRFSEWPPCSRQIQLKHSGLVKYRRLLIWRAVTSYRSKFAKNSVDSSCIVSNSVDSLRQCPITSVFIQLTYLCVEQGSFFGPGIFHRPADALQRPLSVTMLIEANFFLWVCARQRRYPLTLCGQVEQATSRSELPFPNGPVAARFDVALRLCTSTATGT